MGPDNGFVRVLVGTVGESVFRIVVLILVIVLPALPSRRAKYLFGSCATVIIGYKLSVDACLSTLFK